MGSEVAVLVAGTARGPVIALDDPLSFWGGLDPGTGEIIDRRHPQSGRVVTGAILAMPHGRGSSSSSAVLAESIRLGTAPAAVVLGEADPIVMLGSLVAAELYGLRCPVVVVPEDLYRRVVGSPFATIDGSSVILRHSA